MDCREDSSQSEPRIATTKGYKLRAKLGGFDNPMEDNMPSYIEPVRRSLANGKRHLVPHFFGESLSMHSLVSTNPAKVLGL